MGQEGKEDRQLTADAMMHYNGRRTVKQLALAACVAGSVMAAHGTAQAGAGFSNSRWEAYRAHRIVDDFCMKRTSMLAPVRVVRECAQLRSDEAQMHKSIERYWSDARRVFSVVREGRAYLAMGKEVPGKLVAEKELGVISLKAVTRSINETAQDARINDRHVLEYIEDGRRGGGIRSSGPKAPPSPLHPWYSALFTGLALLAWLRSFLG